MAMCYNNDTTSAPAQHGVCPRRQSDMGCRLLKESEVQRDACQFMHYRYFFGERAVLGELRLTSSLRHTLWMFSLVRSRSFGDVVDGESLTLMAPFLDLANHADTINGNFRISEDRCVLCHPTLSQSQISAVDVAQHKLPVLVPEALPTRHCIHHGTCLLARSRRQTRLSAAQ